MKVWVPSLGKRCYVDFVHTHYDRPVPVGRYWAQGNTTCYFRDENSKVPLLMGTAFCSVNDQFNKARGRKFALDRALRTGDVVIPRAERSKIWESYHARGNSWNY